MPLHTVIEAGLVHDRARLVRRAGCRRAVELFRRDGGEGGWPREPRLPRSRHERVRAALDAA